MSDVLKEGNTAVITGASSGIGRAAALECAKRGMHVWLVDIDQVELQTARELVQSQARNGLQQKIEARTVDVSNFEAVQALANEVFQNNGKCHFLMNNAGIGAGGGSMTNMNVVHKVMGVNTFGPMHGCLAFLPRMKAMKEAAWVVTTGSKQGITMPPGNLTYNISKAAVKAYTEGLEHELRNERAQQEHEVRAALLIPGWVNTSIMLKTKREEAAKVGDDSFDPNAVLFHEDKPHSGAWMPHQIVDFMVQELDQGRFYIVCPDNDVDRHTDNLRMTWTMQDITQDRPPLSRWHPDFKDKFDEFVQANPPK